MLLFVCAGVTGASDAAAGVPPGCCVDPADVGRYSLVELQGAHRGGPLDIDFAHKEEYLADDEFMKVREAMYMRMHAYNFGAIPRLHDHICIAIKIRTAVMHMHMHPDPLLAHAHV